MVKQTSFSAPSWQPVVQGKSGKTQGQVQGRSWAKEGPEIVASLKGSIGFRQMRGAKTAEKRSEEAAEGGAQTQEHRERRA